MANIISPAVISTYIGTWRKMERELGGFTSIDVTLY